MKVVVFTLVLDGMPWIPCIFAALNGTRGIDWVWMVAHGVADNNKCTSWCKKIPPRLSTDGTLEFLQSIRSHPRVKIEDRELWESKVDMCNWAVGGVSRGDIVFQMDSDELWTPRQVELVAKIMSNGDQRNCAMFRCRYFVGPHLYLFDDNKYGNHDFEWKRAWRCESSRFLFETHEPPVANQREIVIGKGETSQIGLVFDHYAYATEKQVLFKEHYYGYTGASEQWKSMIRNATSGDSASRFLPWISGDPKIVETR